tara:strand:+ start:40 stop:477 length:438 start_codon:yes stop_codon:yes gene_type:complete
METSTEKVKVKSESVVAVALIVAVMTMLALGTSGCRKHAPTSYELDQRAGHGVPPMRWKDRHWRGKKRPRGAAWQERLSTTSALAPQTSMPARTAPVVRKVWVADQQLEDGSWVQGTWMYVEVEPARWLYEVDPTSAPFATGGQP